LLQRHKARRFNHAAHACLCITDAHTKFNQFFVRREDLRILYINNDGSGFADYIDVPHGTTVQELFEREMAQSKPDNYLIRVNRQPATRDQVLVEMDRVSFTPTKIEGACC
jgi:hypothetical protein